ncbi:MAG TPA: pitrilysin family protein [Polyangia bacterium]|nr:pitrilysin family protein [Polyangia bacterium]
MITSFQLGNGLHVILQESHLAPVVAFQAWVGVGSADEPEELAGIAHVFEHMLFKGTARRGVGQIAHEVESSGGEINAWTSFDETVYHLVMSSRYFDTGLDIITDALRNSSFDPAELERELKVVREEVKQGEDAPSRVATQRLFARAYTKHPYRRPVIGYARTVERFTREELLRFFHEHYVASNITLVVVGDFDTPAARRQIEALWGDAPRGAPVRLVPRPEEPVQTEPRAVAGRGDVRELHLSIAFHIPGLVHPDASALDVGAILLGQGDSSRLVREVKRNRQVVTDAYAYAYSPRDPGLLVAGATLPPGQLDVAFDALLDEILRLGREEVTPEELDKAKAIVESDAVYQKETVQGMARKLGFYRAVAGSLEHEAEYQRQVRDLGPRQLREALARYLRPENATVALLGPAQVVPQGDETQVEAHLVARLRAAWERAERRWGAPQVVADDVVREVLPSGTRVVVYRDTSVPLVAMRAVWEGGLRAEDERTNGVTNLIASLITRGTHTRSADALAHEVESMAGSIGGFSGRNSFGIRAEVMARHWERGLDILLDCVLHPRLSEEELEKERRQVLEELHTQEDSISSVTFRLFAQALYPRHPYRMDPLGTPESVGALTRAQLVDYYRRHFPPSRMTLAIVGDVDPAAVLARLRAALGATPGEVPGLTLAPPLPRVTSAAAHDAPREPRRVEKFLNKQQAHLVIGFPGTTISSPDRFALELLATILSGQGGRLFVELRDKRGLAYRVSAFSIEGLDPGYFAVYIATSPTNLEVAQAAIRDELNKVMDHLVGAGELERAKRYLAGAHDISLQRRSALASAISFNECYGLGWDEYRRYSTAILGVTAEEVRRVAREYLAPERAVVAVVRPDEEALALQRRHEAAEARAQSHAAPTGHKHGHGKYRRPAAQHGKSKHHKKRRH